MVWVKQVVDSVSMSTWSRSFYQNALAVPPMLLVSLISGEMAIVLRGGAGSFAWGMVAASCVAGVGMSYFSFALRAVISATSFSVIGNVCKVLTILVNMMMWDQHSSEFLKFFLFWVFFDFVFFAKTNKKNSPVFFLSPTKNHPQQQNKTKDALGTSALFFCLLMGSFYQQPPMRRGATVSSSAIGGGVFSAIAGSVGVGSGKGASSSPSFFGGGSGKTSPVVQREELGRIAAHKGGVAAAV